jgi:predicted DNA-binding WGR domain protein
MPDELRSPIKHHLVQHRIDPEQGIRRFYHPMIERDLFGTVRLVRNWGRAAPGDRSWSRSSSVRSKRAKPSRRLRKRRGGGAPEICEAALLNILIAKKKAPAFRGALRSDP